MYCMQGTFQADMQCSTPRWPVCPRLLPAGCSSYASFKFLTPGITVTFEGISPNQPTIEIITVFEKWKQEFYVVPQIFLCSEKMGCFGKLMSFVSMKHLCMRRAVFASLLDIDYELRPEE